jgi:hypothetical protein
MRVSTQNFDETASDECAVADSFQCAREERREKHNIQRVSTKERKKKAYINPNVLSKKTSQVPRAS